MSTEKNATSGNHKLCLEDREKLMIDGIRSVEAFSDKEIALITIMGKLTIKGENLHIEKFNKDTGEFLSTGSISSLLYSKASADKGSFIERLFK